MRRPTETNIIFQNSSTTPLGAIKFAGFIKQSHGKGQGRQRRLGSYALVYSLSGGCNYWDERVGKRSIKAGDLIILFPDIAHRYGAGPRGHWDEFFIVFHGPIFDLWQSKGILDPGNPILHLEPIPYWLRRLQSCLDTRGVMGWSATLQQICNLQAVLTEIASHAVNASPISSKPAWLDPACQTLSDHSIAAFDMAKLAVSLGVSPETFRKKFTQIMGMSPGRFRAARIIDQACELILKGDLSGKEIAELLGFSDEYHFSKRFKQITGYSPTAFREQMCPAS